jgi:CheY-like chemotaxis protein
MASSPAGYLLVVDDDPDAREILSTLAEAMGLTVRIACDGSEALEFAAEQPPALILLDLMMPNMNGFSVLAKLQCSPKTRKVPVIIVSAASASDRSVMTMMPNVIDVVSKGSFTIDGMMTIIARALHMESHLRLLAAGSATPIPLPNL